jgi:hypothetical protein
MLCSEFILMPRWLDLIPILDVMPIWIHLNVNFVAIFYVNCLILCPPYLYERVHEWTHEPRYTFYYKKQHFVHFTAVFYFQLLLICKIQKYFLYCISQTQTLQLYLLLFIIPLHITLVCIFPCQPRTISDFLALLHLHIYLFSIAYLYSVLYTYTHLVLDNHLVRLRAQSKFILLCRLLEEGQEGSLYTHFPESLI